MKCVLMGHHHFSPSNYLKLRPATLPSPAEKQCSFFFIFSVLAPEHRENEKRNTIILFRLSEHQENSHPDIEEVGEGVHVLDAERILFSQLIKQSQGLVDICGGHFQSINTTSTYLELK